MSRRDRFDPLPQIRRGVRYRGTQVSDVSMVEVLIQREEKCRARGEVIVDDGLGDPCPAGQVCERERVCTFSGDDVTGNADELGSPVGAGESSLKAAQR
nr:hypothetical protein [Streptomyces sp. MK37H]